MYRLLSNDATWLRTGHCDRRFWKRLCIALTRTVRKRVLHESTEGIHRPSCQRCQGRQLPGGPPIDLSTWISRFWQHSAPFCDALLVTVRHVLRQKRTFLATGAQQNVNARQMLAARGFLRGKCFAIEYRVLHERATACGAIACQRKALTRNNSVSFLFWAIVSRERRGKMSWTCHGQTNEEMVAKLQRESRESGTKAFHFTCILCGHLHSAIFVGGYLLDILFYYGD